MEVLQSNVSGLTEQEASARLQQFGPNAIEFKKTHAQQKTTSAFGKSVIENISPPTRD